MAADKLLTAGSDRKFKTWNIDMDKCGADKDAGLEKNWECTFEVKESDMVLQPRAIAYNEGSGTVLCGTKTNQIVDGHYVLHQMNVYLLQVVMIMQ